MTVTGSLSHLPQDVTLDTALSVAQALGIAERRAALRAIEAGVVRPETFETLGDDWDVEERALATLGSLGFDDLDLDRTVDRLSGGQCVLLRLAAVLLPRPDVLLLDEPTNNLDLVARGRLHRAVEGWRAGLLLVVSHDRELLERVDRVAELRSGTVTWYGGGWSAYRAAVAAQQETAERLLRTARADVRRQRRDLAAAETVLARRQRHSRKLDAERSAPKIVANERKKGAQVSAAKLREVHQDRVRQAADRCREAADAVRDDAEIRVDLPHTAVPTGRTVAEARGLRLCHGPDTPLDLHLRGPERIALLGRNGSGKTTLLRTLAGELVPAAGIARVSVPLRFLPQRLDVLDEELGLTANLARFAPEAGDQQIRSRLARFRFTGDEVTRAVRTLSGGERFRATLTALMLATPAPQLLMLDEPTNNLDLASVEQLVSALAGYRGALLVASHDLPFLATLDITRWWLLDGGLHETTPTGFGPGRTPPPSP